MCREFPFRFKAVCSPSSYLSRVIYFLISLSLSPLTTSLSFSLWVNLSGSHVDEEGERKVNKSLWRQLFPPHRSLVSFLHYLSCFAFYLFMHRSRFAPPHFLLHRLFPVSDPLSYHRTTSYTYSSPEEHIDFILGANSKPVPRNYKIRKLLDTTLASSSERSRYALESSQRLTDEGRRPQACRR